MPDPVHLIPLAEIDDAALPRDRTGLDPEPHGRAPRLDPRLRPAPCRSSSSRSPPRGAAAATASLSGFRRLAAFRDPARATGLDRYAAIPAFLREPPDLAATLAAMVEENEIRADLSPCERGRIAVTRPRPGRLPHHRGGRRRASTPPPTATSARACAASPASPRCSTAASPRPKNCRCARRCASPTPAATASAT